MKVKDVMTRDVKACQLESNLSEAAKEMWMRDCGVLPVIDKEGQLAGIITDRDICIAAACKNQVPSSIRASEVITRSVHSCSPDDDIHDALQIMQQKKVRRLPVADATGKLCGILSLNDVAIAARAATKPAELSAEDVERTLAAICQHRPLPQQQAA